MKICEKDDRRKREKGKREEKEKKGKREKPRKKEGKNTESQTPNFGQLHPDSEIGNIFFLSEKEKRPLNIARNSIPRTRMAIFALQ